LCSIVLFIVCFFLILLFYRTVWSNIIIFLSVLFNHFILLDGLVQSYYFIGRFGTITLFYWTVWCSHIILLDGLVQSYYFIGRFGVVILFYWMVWWSHMILLDGCEKW